MKCLSALAVMGWLALAATEDTFIKEGVVPDVVDTSPREKLEVVYNNGASLKNGNELTPTEVKDLPSISWPTEDGAFYTLVMTDPDAPSRSNPIRREFLHFLVGNIPRNDIEKGTTLAEYVGAGPPKGSGLHRYVFLVYKQPAYIDFNRTTIKKTTTRGRPNFAIRKFAKEWNLGSPVAGSFFQAQYDDYVPILHEQLSREP